MSCRLNRCSKLFKQLEIVPGLFDYASRHIEHSAVSDQQACAARLFATRAGPGQNRKKTNMETHYENIERAHSHLARDRVLADLKTLAHDAEDLLKATAGDVSVKTREIRARLAKALERAQANYAELQEQTVAFAKAAAKKTDVVIREHPYESLGVAFGLGLLIGVLVTRR